MSDPNFSNVSLLLHGNGTDGSTSFVDSSGTPKTVTPFGSAQISTGQSKFGGASMLFDGAADYVTIPNSASFEFGTGEFTIEAFVRLAAELSGDPDAPYSVVDARGDYTSGVAFSFVVSGSGYPNLHLGRSTTARNVAEGYMWTLDEYGDQQLVNSDSSGICITSPGIFYHIAAVRRSLGASLNDVLETYLGGVLSGSTEILPSYSVPTTSIGNILVGAGRVYASPGQMYGFFGGNIDNLRITKGVARYTANFDPPTEEFSDGVEYGADLSIPMMTLDAFVMDMTGTISADQSIPMMTLDAHFGASVEGIIPMMTIAANFGASAKGIIPMMTLNAAAHDSTGENSFQGVIPMMTLEADFGVSVDARIPMMTLDSAITSVALIRVELSIPMMTLDSAGTGSPCVVTAELAIPMMSMNANFGASGEGILPMMTMDASITAGGRLTANLTIPMMTMDATGTRQSYAWADLTIPMMVPVASITADLSIPMMVMDAGITAVVSITYEAYSINLSHAAGNPAPIDEVTRYTNFPFTQIVRYQNSYFGVAADGLYRLEGTTDDGEAIPYSIKTCIDDFKAPELKTVASAYISGRLGPNATVTLHAGEDGAESYDYSTLRGQAAQTHREKFGRGVKNRYFALGLAGEGTLEVDSIEFEVAKLTRRI